MTRKIIIHPNEFSVIRLTHYMKMAFPDKSVAEMKRIVEHLQDVGKPIVIPHLEGNGVTIQCVTGPAYKMSAEESDRYWEYDPLICTFSNPDVSDAPADHHLTIQREWNREYNTAIKNGDREAAMRALVLLDQNPWLMCASAS